MVVLLVCPHGFTRLGFNTEHDFFSGLLLGYMTVGSVCFATMISLGEMVKQIHIQTSIYLLKPFCSPKVAYLPITGGHIKLAERFVNPAFSFAMGWNYWYNWVIILPAELR